jgi:membrane fusion protein
MSGPASAGVSTAEADSDVLIVLPAGTRLLTVLVCGFTATIFGFLYFGQYTQRQRVSGVLVPSTGLVKVYTPRSGTVQALHVEDAQHVEPGQLLYTISSAQVSAEKRDLHLDMQRALVAQRQSLEEERVRQSAINGELRATARRTVATLRRELDDIRSSQQIADRQVALAREAASRYERLAEKGLSAQIEVEARRLELLERESQRMALGRLLELEPEREIRVAAAVAGTVTGIVARIGQQVSETVPLLSLLPDGATLEAELYAPSSAISFIKEGNPVSLRYRAFPYQKFGQHAGTVREVSRAAVPIAEVNQAAASDAAQGPVYRILVSLPAPTILAYGRREALQAGMEVEADILLDSRRLYEWILEPLFSVTGRS